MLLDGSDLALEIGVSSLNQDETSFTLSHLLFTWENLICDSVTLMIVVQNICATASTACDDL